MKSTSLVLAPGQVEWLWGEVPAAVMERAPSIEVPRYLARVLNCGVWSVCLALFMYLGTFNVACPGQASTFSTFNPNWSQTPDSNVEQRTNSSNIGVWTMEYWVRTSTSLQMSAHLQPQAGNQTCLPSPHPPAKRKCVALSASHLRQLLVQSSYCLLQCPSSPWPLDRRSTVACGPATGLPAQPARQGKARRDWHTLTNLAPTRLTEPLSQCPTWSLSVLSLPPGCARVCVRVCVRACG